MKKYTKYIQYITILAIASLLFSCSGKEEYIQSTAKKGPFVKFVKAVPSEIKGKVSSWSLSEEVEAPSNNVQSYQLYVGTNTTSTPTIVTAVKLTSFPTKLEISGSEVLTVLSKTDADFPADNSRLIFYGVVTGTDGIVAKDFPGDRNVSNDFINWNDGTKSAYRFIMDVKK